MTCCTLCEINLFMKMTDISENNASRMHFGYRRYSENEKKMPNFSHNHFPLCQITSVSNNEDNLCAELFSFY